jgi:regulator of replication initiation timing
MNMFMDGLQGGETTGMTVPRRRKVWEIDQVFRCPVVGMCLSISEQRSLCRKVGAGVHSKSDFAVHEMVVSTMDAENPLSRKLESLLSRKYEAANSTYLSMSEEEFLDHWRGSLARGDYAGMLWAAAVRPLSHVGLVEVFGTMHMSMHEHVKAYGTLKASLAVAERNHSAARSDKRDAEKQNVVLRSENSRLRRALSSTQAMLEQERRTEPVEQTVPNMNTGSDPKHDRLAARLDRLEQELAVKDRELEDLREALRTAQREEHRLQDEFLSHLAKEESAPKSCSGSDCGRVDCTPQCPSYDLCKKRVLIVGGIERMEKSYRKLIEERGGVFEYHAGHMKSGGKGLENSVQRADLVLCPVNCNSHGACLKVKNLGKKFRKPVHMLSNFSLSAVARTMEELHGAN